MRKSHRARLKQVVENTNCKPGLIFDVIVQVLVVLSLLAYAVETLPDLSPTIAVILDWFEVASVVAFGIEYGLRLWVADSKTKYAFSFFGIIDLLAILPFIIGLGLDTRSIRIFRLLRLFRIFKLARYSRAIRRFHVAIDIAKEEIVLFLCVTLILIYLASIGIHVFEGEAQPKTFGSVFHCMWWAVATLTTVGYGDVYPITVGGKIFTFVILLLGLGFISVPAGLVASALSKARQLEDMKMQQEQETEP